LPAFKHTIGDEHDMRLFEEEAKRALGILRNNPKLRKTLFLLMLGTGIPELKEPENIMSINKRLCMEMTDEQAGHAFEQLIKESITSTA
jgi:hypothetical protein